MRAGPASARFVVFVVCLFLIQRSTPQLMYIAADDSSQSRPPLGHYPTVSHTSRHHAHSLSCSPCAVRLSRFHSSHWRPDPAALPGVTLLDSVDARDLSQTNQDLVSTGKTNAGLLANGLPPQRPRRLFDPTRTKRQLPSNVPFSCNGLDFAMCCKTVSAGGTGGSMCSSAGHSSPAWSVLLPTSHFPLPMSPMSLRYSNTSRHCSSRTVVP
jgi:hypothetical protein